MWAPRAVSSASEGVGAGGGGALAGDEEEVADAVAGDQVAGGEGAEGAGAAGDQDRALRAERWRRLLSANGRLEAGGQQPSVPDADLGLAAGQGLCDVIRSGTVGVQEHEPVGLLGLGGAHQAPDSGLGRRRRLPVRAATPPRVCTTSREPSGCPSAVPSASAARTSRRARRTPRLGDGASRARDAQDYVGRYLLGGCSGWDLGPVRLEQRALSLGRRCWPEGERGDRGHGGASGVGDGDGHGAGRGGRRESDAETGSTGDL